jgi:hypothetical protein
MVTAFAFPLYHGSPHHHPLLPESNRTEFNETLGKDGI